MQRQTLQREGQTTFRALETENENRCHRPIQKNNEQNEINEKTNDSHRGNMEQMDIALVPEPDPDVTIVETHSENVKEPEPEEPEYAESIKNEECLGDLELKQEKEEEVIKEIIFR